MAIEYIQYPGKQFGDKWTANEANEVKNVVNNNAMEMSTMATSLSSVASRTTALEGRGVTVSQSQATVEISPNVLNVWSSAVQQLTVSFAAGQSGIANEYMLQFTVSGSSFTLTLPSGVRWADEPEWESGWTYQVSIENGLAIGYGWPPA